MSPSRAKRRELRTPPPTADAVGEHARPVRRAGRLGGLPLRSSPQRRTASSEPLPARMCEPTVAWRTQLPHPPSTITPQTHTPPPPTPTVPRPPGAPHAHLAPSRSAIRCSIVCTSRPNSAASLSPHYRASRHAMLVTPRPREKNAPHVGRQTGQRVHPHRLPRTLASVGPRCRRRAWRAACPLQPASAG